MITILFAILLLSAGAGCHRPSLYPQPTHPIPIPDVASTQFRDPDLESVRQLLAESIGAHDRTDGANTVDLPGAISEGIAKNLFLALAGERVASARAYQIQARSLALPNLVVGANYRYHDGPVINATGFILDGPLQSIYFGNGAEVRGAGTVTTPGIRLFTHLGDAFLEPAVAERVHARESASELATGNQIVLDIETAYSAIATAQGRLLVLQRAELDLTELHRIIRNHAKAGQIRDSDLHRADSELKLGQSDIEKAHEEISTARINLARMIRRDNFEELQAVDVIPFFPGDSVADAPLATLLDEAIANRPELVAAQQEIGEWEIRVRQEKVRPFLPIVSIGFSSGWFSAAGTPSQNRFSALDGRTDLDIALIWTARNLGIGNHAAAQIATSRLRSAQLAYSRRADDVRRQVVEAHVAVRARREEVKTALARLKHSQAGYIQDMFRLKNLEVRPLEVLDNLNQLTSARLELIQAFAAYSLAQFQLQASIARY